MTVSKGSQKNNQGKDCWCFPSASYSRNQSSKSKNPKQYIWAIGPYCHAIRSGNLIFCSGQAPVVAVKQNPLDALVEIECIAEIPE